uniref:Integrator complex subunit 4/Protein SIEL C-terminal Ig-like domain-containing protein n=1 Tax=Graphocephala atropunctata TaxID=36148 RepID=A0A1B6KQK6_9HEMI
MPRRTGFGETYTLIGLQRSMQQGSWLWLTLCVSPASSSVRSIAKLICHQVWTEALYVDISLAMDLTELEAGLTHKVSHSQDPCCIDLCKPIKVYVSPKPVRRGI